jgi:hypothetical protein
MPKITIGTSPPYVRIRTEAFWARFTVAELVDYDVAMQHNPADNAATKKNAARLRVFQRQMDIKGFVRLNAQTVIDFVNGLAPSVITAARATAILTAATTADEAYIVPGEMS